MDIFLNNEMYLIKTYLGIITCGGYALILTIYNASFFGFFVGAAFYERGLNYILLHTIPHSFELIPLILSAADSVYIGIYLFLNIVGKCKIRIDYKEYIIKFIGYSIILFLAAICEVYVSIGK